MKNAQFNLSLDVHVGGWGKKSETITLGKGRFRWHNYFYYKDVSQ